MEFAQFRLGVAAQRLQLTFALVLVLNDVHLVLSHHARIQHEISQGFENYRFQRLTRDAPGVALVGLTGAAADVVVEFFFIVAEMHAVSVHRGTAAGAVNQPGEEKRGSQAARMLRVFLAGELHDFVFLVHSLDEFPGALIDHGINVVLDHALAEMQLTQVKAIFKKSFVTVDRFVELGAAVDRAVRLPLGAHLPGSFAALPGFGIRHPARHLVGGSIPAFAEFDQFTLESTRGRAWQRAVLFEVMMQPAFDVRREIQQKF